MLGKSGQRLERFSVQESRRGPDARSNGSLGRNFQLLWCGQSVSALGTQITALVIPLLAVQTLGATPGQMGVLRSSQFSPFLFLALFIGPLIDSRHRKKMMVGASFLQGCLLFVIPLAGHTSRLNLELLIVVMFCVGALQVIFDMAYQADVQVIVARPLLTKANGRLQAFICVYPKRRWPFGRAAGAVSLRTVRRDMRRTVVLVLRG
jgi:MFS family permease